MCILKFNLFLDNNKYQNIAGENNNCKVLREIQIIRKKIVL